MSSRQIAEAHYKLSMVLDLTSGRLSDAIEHVEKALESVLERIQELKDGLGGESPPVPVAERGEDKKGKGKGTPSLLLAGDLVRNMSKSQMESELQEMEGLKEDLALKVGRTIMLPNML
jgi:HAT1-interacting factor 1